MMNRQSRNLVSISLVLILAGLLNGCCNLCGKATRCARTRASTAATVTTASGLTQVDELTLTGPKNFIRDYDTLNTDGTVNFIVEIPTGTNEKWEVSKDGSKLAWDIRDGKPRIVKYLGYLGNYGSLPRTKAADGDPLDVLALGPTQQRGSLVRAKIIGVMKYREDDAKTGAEDNKLLALLPDSPLYNNVNSLAELDAKYPGISQIVRTWFDNYKGHGVMFFQGFGDKAEAQALLDAGIQLYTTK